MTGGSWAKSRWFWVKSSTRSVADMMISFSGRSLCGRTGSVTHGHPAPGSPLPSQPPSSPVLTPRTRKRELTAGSAYPGQWLVKGSLKSPKLSSSGGQAGWAWGPPTPRVQWAWSAPTGHSFTSSSPAAHGGFAPTTRHLPVLPSVALSASSSQTRVCLLPAALSESSPRRAGTVALSTGEHRVPGPAWHTHKSLREGPYLSESGKVATSQQRYNGTAPLDPAGL